VLARYANRQMPAGETGDTEPYAVDDENPCYSTRRVRVGGRDHEIMLDIRQPNGNRLALPYIGLLAIVHDPSEGITLKFQTHDVRLSGSNLQPLYTALTLHHVQWVAVSDEGSKGDGCVLHGIDIEETE
jgi:hypothetical protein